MQELETLMEAEQSRPWARTTGRELAGQLAEVAESFYIRGDALASETAKQMGVTPAAVWFEVIFPSVWGFLSAYSFLKSRDAPLGEIPVSEPNPTDCYAGSSAVRLLPSNSFQRVLLPGFSGYALLRSSGNPSPSPARGSGLALCLLPFNLASIGVLDILHLLCHGPKRVVAKLSEKVPFLKAHLDEIFAPLLTSRAVAFVEGGADTGSWLAARPEFDRIHLTGGARTAAAVEAVAGKDKVTCELGGVTPAIVLPEVVQDERLLRQAARQVAFGALANNGQHCVSYQVVMVPDSLRAALGQSLEAEMALAAVATGFRDPHRTLIDEKAASRVVEMVEDASRLGASVNSFGGAPQGRRFPMTLLNGITDEMRLFREEVFGPVLGLMSFPDKDFTEEAVSRVNQPALAGDLGASLFTPAPKSEPVQRMARQLKHGVVAINSYPGVSFATSLPWGAGPGQVSGRGWVHNYRFLAESRLEKVVLAAPLGRKGPGPFAWEDPWLPNVSGPGPLRLAKSLVKAALAFFKRQPLRLLTSQSWMIPALMHRELSARRQDRSL